MFKLANFIKSRKIEARDLVEFQIFRGKNKEPARRHYRSVRIGVNWPQVEQPGAFCVVGMEYEKDDPNWDRLQLLCEFKLEELFLERFFSRLVESYHLYGCDTVYLDRDDKPCFHPWQDYNYRHGSRADYTDIPYKENPFSGLALAMDLLDRGRLILPQESLTWQEADQLEYEAIDKNLGKNFPLVCALKNVVCGFSAHPPIRPMKIPSGPGSFSGIKGGWMI